MITIIIKITRDSLNTPFVKRTESEEFTKYFHEKYELTGKFLGKTIELSEDKLSLLVISKWLSRNDYLEYMLDDVVMDNKEKFPPLGPEFTIKEYTPNAGEP
jgi:hypothetical protein